MLFGLQIILIYEMELGNSLLFLFSLSLTDSQDVLYLFFRFINRIKLVKTTGSLLFIT